MEGNSINVQRPSTDMNRENFGRVHWMVVISWKVKPGSVRRGGK